MSLAALCLSLGLLSGQLPGPLAQSQAVVSSDGLRDAAENRRFGNASPVVEFGVSLNIPAGGVPALPGPVDAIQGRATWYRAPSKVDAAAGPLLREWLGEDWRGTWVTVSRGDRSVTVQLRDWCRCERGRRLVDLDDDAFAELAPLGRGVIRIVITRANVTAPATDTE